MKKLIAASVVLAGVLGSTATQADQVCCFNVFSGGSQGWGGIQVWMNSGNYCAMGVNDTLVNFMFAMAGMIKANPWGSSGMYNANQVGNGYGTYGGQNCYELYAQ